MAGDPIDSPTPPRLWSKGASGRLSRPVESRRQNTGSFVITLDCGHTFAVDQGCLHDGWGETSVECQLEHVISKRLGGPLEELAPRVFEAEERIRRARRIVAGHGGASLFVEMERLLVRLRDRLVVHGDGPEDARAIAAADGLLVRIDTASKGGT